MKARSAKNKGQRATKQVKEKLLQSFPELEEDDIKVVPAGVTGEDLWISPKARKLLPFCWEIKNQEKLNIWAANAQAKEHSVNTKHIPIVCYKRNRSDFYVSMTLESFLKVLKNEK